MDKLVKLVQGYQATDKLSERLAIADEIIREVGPALWGFIRRRCPEDAVEDVHQESLVDIASGLPTARPTVDEQFWRWCYQLAWRNVADYFRKRGKEPLTYADPDLFDAVTETLALEEGLAKDEYTALHEALEAFRNEEPALCALLQHYYFDRLTYPQIARMTGRTKDAVRMQVNRGLTKLQQWIAKRESLAQRRKK